MSAKRILLMYISEVSGHRQAICAIEKSLKAVDPSVEMMSINGFGYTYPKMEKIINTAYMGIIKKTPKIWGYLYDNPKVAKRIQSLRKAIYKANHGKFDKLFAQFRPDVVVCSQAFPCGMVADYKQSCKLPVKVVGVLTDYAPHSYWIHEGVDDYVVPSKETGDALVKKGVLQERVKVLGIPVDAKFSIPLDKARIAQELGLHLDTPVIFMMGGGQGLGPIKDVAQSLVDMAVDLQIIVVTGTNKKLNTWLKKIQQKSAKKILVFEYVQNIEELMEIATLIVTKPGGMTTTEALTKGLPMVIVNPIPGQEAYNAEFLLSQGVAIRVDDVKCIGEDIERLLKDSARLERMRSAALANSKPNSSLDIARLILQNG